MLSTIKFLWLAVRPISKLETAWDWWQIVNIIPPVAYIIVPRIIEWSNNMQLAWFAGIPALLLLIAGIKLQMKLMPKIKLVYEDKEPYKTVNEPYTHNTGKSIPSRVRYKVGLQLLGTKATELKVTLFESEPSIPRIPADLCSPPPNMSQSPTFTVYPKDEITDFVQVVSYPWQNEETGEKEIQVDFQYNSVQIARGKYIFTLLVQGKDVPLYKRKFVAEVDNNDELQFYPI